MPPSEKSPRMIRLITALLLVATFAVGTVTGGVLVHWFVVRSSPQRQFPPPLGLWNDLDLTAEQRDKVHAILERYRPKLDAILYESFPKVRAVNDLIDQEIRGILMDEQRRKFDQEKSQRHHGPLPPPPMPPGNWPPEGMPGPLGAPPGPPPNLPPPGSPSTVP